MTGTGVRDERFAQVIGPSAPLIETIFDAIPFGLSVAWPVFDDAGAVVDVESGYTNPEAERILNVPLASLVGTRMREAIPGLIEFGLYDRLVRVIESGMPESAELEVDTLWEDTVQVRGFWLHHAIPFGWGVLSATADITEERRRQAELRDFAAVAAHDLREPLIGIHLMAGLLSRRGTLGATEQEMVSTLGDGALRARGLIDGILEYATADGEGAARRDVDCGQVVGEVLAALEAQIERVSARVEVGALPVLAADRTGLHRLFQNLIANALKFRAAGDPVVAVSAAKGDGAWTFSVRDNGIGLPDGPAIFEMFTRGGADHEGSGIGLATCRRIVESHGGRIWAEPSPGGGSTFSFTLPG